MPVKDSALPDNFAAAFQSLMLSKNSDMLLFPKRSDPSLNFRYAYLSSSSGYIGACVETFCI